MDWLGVGRHRSYFESLPLRQRRTFSKADLRQHERPGGMDSRYDEGALTSPIGVGNDG